jgi:hypothetical protein
MVDRMSKILMTRCQLQRKRYLLICHTLALNVSELVIKGIRHCWFLQFKFSCQKKNMKNYMSDDKPQIAEKRETQTTLLQAIVMFVESQAKI